MMDNDIFAMANPWQTLPMADAHCTINATYLETTAADALFAHLLEATPWQQPVLRIYGKTVTSPRLEAWFGDDDADYVYSGLRHRPHPWSAQLKALKHQLEQDLDCQFNSVLLNRYRNGDDAMGWHSDDEMELGPQPTIASISLGQARAFKLRRRKPITRPNRAQSIVLTHGSCLVMAGQTQQHWQHGISRSNKDFAERINLTFRLVKAHW